MVDLRPCFHHELTSAIAASVASSSLSVLQFFDPRQNPAISCQSAGEPFKMHIADWEQSPPRCAARTLTQVMNMMGVQPLFAAMRAWSNLNDPKADLLLLSVSSVFQPPRGQKDRSGQKSFCPLGHRRTKLRPPMVCAPGAGQFSCGGFDSLPGVVILELCWA